MTVTAADRITTRFVRGLRRTLDSVETALRPDDAGAPGRDDAQAVDGTTTREILVPRATGEPAANRATRQARDYLARRRRKLREDLDAR